MKLNTRFMTRNDCYQIGKKITPTGIMLHSTATPGVMAANWFGRWNKSYQAGETSRQVAVHAFVDDTEVWQYLPWNHRGWHAGGSANNTHIGIEICEPDGFSYVGGSTMKGYIASENEHYFRKAWQNAVELCAMLCEEFGLLEADIISHSEGNRQGIASNHADVMHWFPKHGESMDTFRSTVKSVLQESSTQTNLSPKIAVGDVVEIKSSAGQYYPGGATIPDWVKKDTYHKVTQVVSNGKQVIKGGKACVLLGRKVDKKNKTESAGIMSWIDRDALQVVQEEGELKKEKGADHVYRVQVGAFSNRANAETLLQQVKTAGFDGYIRME